MHILFPILGTTVLTIL